MQNNSYMPSCLQDQLLTTQDETSRSDKSHKISKEKWGIL